MLDTHGRKYINGLFAGLAGGLLKLGLSPNQVTALAFVLGLAAAHCCTPGWPGGRRPPFGCPGCWTRWTGKWPAGPGKAVCWAHNWISSATGW